MIILKSMPLGLYSWRSHVGHAGNVDYVVNADNAGHVGYTIVNNSNKAGHNGRSFYNLNYVISNNRLP